MAYPIVVIPIIVGCIVQSIKFLLSIIKHKKIEFKYLLGPGHMPSAHTAFVVSLATVVAYNNGVFSTAFAVSFVLAYIVIYDALKIRIHIGHNGRIINRLVKETSGIKKESYPMLKERVGHRVEEIFVGGVLGFFLTVLSMVILNKGLSLIFRT